MVKINASHYIKLGVGNGVTQEPPSKARALALFIAAELLLNGSNLSPTDGSSRGGRTGAQGQLDSIRPSNGM